MLSVCHTTDLCQGEMLLMLVCSLLILTLFRVMRIPINVRLPDDRCSEALGSPKKPQRYGKSEKNVLTKPQNDPFWFSWLCSSISVGSGRLSQQCWYWGTCIVSATSILPGLNVQTIFLNAYIQIKHSNLMLLLPYGFDNNYMYFNH